MGNMFFLTNMHNFMPQIETERKAGPSKGKKYDFAMKFSLRMALVVVTTLSF